jgi:hypothetical protein
VAAQRVRARGASRGTDVSGLGGAHARTLGRRTAAPRSATTRPTTRRREERRGGDWRESADGRRETGDGGGAGRDEARLG